jgi:hypothetical protein
LLQPAGLREASELLRADMAIRGHNSWTYPIFITDSQADEANCATTLSLGASEIAIGWRASELKPSDSGFLERVETAAVAACASWQSLTVLDKALPIFGHNFLTATTTPTHSIRAVRVLAKQVIDASRPVCWTIDRELLEILEAMCRVWRTSELCLAVNDNTDLVSLIYDQLQAEAREANTRLFGRLAFFIACMSLASAAKGMIEFWILGKRWIVAITVTAIVIGAIVILQLTKGANGNAKQRGSA